MLTAVAAVERQIWAVGHDAVILQSADAGATWSLRHSRPDEDTPLLDVWVGGGGRGLAVGAYGLALTSADGSSAWRPVTVDPEERHLNAIVAAPDGTLYIAGENGVVFSSRDEGRTWSATQTPYHGSFFDVLALEDGAVVVLGLRGHIFRSDDHGVTWRAILSHTTATLLSGVRLGLRSLMIVGLSGTVLMSEDGGHRFSERNLPDRRGIAQALPLDDERVLLVGEGGFHTVRRGAAEGM
jgi:photosystem II stability/assembly factor-like uncharacterized protein